MMDKIPASEAQGHTATEHNGHHGFMSAVGCVVLFCFIPHGNWGKISEHVNQALVVEHTKSSSRRENR